MEPVDGAPCFFSGSLTLGVSVAGETLLIAGSVAGLLPLDAQALHLVFLVGDNLSGKR
jgi:hypothetical protein